MRKLLLMMSVGAALAGCDKGPSTAESAAKTGDIRLENATAEEVMKQAAAAQDKNKMQPGEWENTVQLVSAEMPGVPEMLRKQMEAEAKKPPETKKECKKEEDSKAIDFTKLAPAAQGCTFPKYVAADGKLDAEMECKGPFGPVKMTISGSQSSTSYGITMTQAQSMPGQTAQSKMTIRATGKRIGACKA
ncbi:DUF3617 domain-containing protein [Sphingomonas sp.]|jgi:hypothetical protein|uniref:DUF3617 domain-containing protein n=1 Tax=Sphingomonas sp. TaxID=28214 RepID=UPI002EDA9221